MAESGSLTVYPSAFLNNESTYNSKSGENNPIGKGSSNTSASGRATFGASTSKKISAVYSFDLSPIPANAEINSVACVGRFGAGTSTTITLELKSASTVVASNSGNAGMGTMTIRTAGGAWTRSMLDVFRICITSALTSYSLYFYGADLTVTYTYQTEKFMLKLGGAWHDVARVFKKVNGIWVEQTDLANVIEDGVKYKNGGEIESTGPALISFTIAGTSYQAEEGMTWGEWVASSYNTGGFGALNFFGQLVVQDSNGKKVADTTGSVVRQSEEILSGYAYTAF